MHIRVELLGVLLVQEVSELGRHVTFLHIYGAQTWTVVTAFHKILIKQHILVVDIVTLVMSDVSDGREASLE